MELTEREEEIWAQVQADLTYEPVASPDHVERMTTWCQRIGPLKGADNENIVLNTVCLTILHAG